MPKSHRPYPPEFRRRMVEVVRSGRSIEARPLWKTWRKMSGNGFQPPDREEWLNMLRAKEGFLLLRTPHSMGGSRLELEIPSGARYEVYFDDRLQKEGQGRLDLDGVPDQALRIVVTFANRDKWEKKLVSNSGHVFSIRVLEPER